MRDHQVLSVIEVLVPPQEDAYTGYLCEIVQVLDSSSLVRIGNLIDDGLGHTDARRPGQSTGQQVWIPNARLAEWVYVPPGAPPAAPSAAARRRTNA